MEVGDVHFFVQTSDCEHCPPPGGVSTLEAKPSEPDLKYMREIYVRAKSVERFYLTWVDAV